MCNPAAVAVGAQVGGTILGHRAQEKADDANKGIIRENQRLFLFYADDAIRRGKLEANKYKQSIKQLKGRQRAFAGASNVELSGSAARVLSDTETIAQRDIKTITNNAKREAYGYKIQAAGAQAQIEGINAGKRDRMLGTLLTAGGQAMGGMAGKK